MNILANDPSFTAWGWVVINEKNKILDSGCIKTVPEARRKKIRKSDDRVNRAEYIVDTLNYLIDKYKVGLILSELPHGSQNAQAAVMIGIVTGILVAIAKTRKIPFEYFSEQDAKKALSGKRVLSKEDTIEAIDKVYKVSWSQIKYFDEAIADALAIHYVATKQSQLLQLWKQKH